MRYFQVLFSVVVLCLSACTTTLQTSHKANSAPFVWENANVYFLLTDRFFNGNPKNDLQFGRTAQTGKLRGFMGGDLRGIIRKLDEGYFDKLGINAIWLTPVVEQIHGSVDEGTGVSYGFHGYWTKDWTALDPNFGTEADLAELVGKAHRRGIRIVFDVVINHTGPVTEKDPVWPDAWVRTSPQCRYEDYASTVTCTLVKNLPDIRTESNAAVDLPPALVAKWRQEGRLEKEMAELEAFFTRTGYPRAPRFYIIKWLTDYIRKYGVDGYRCDTAKHIEESVWAELRKEADAAFSDWNKAHPEQVLDDKFYFLAEVYNYGISGGRDFNFGDRKVDFFHYGFDALINFEFKSDAQRDYEFIFSKYSGLLHGALSGKTVLNYISSHDDGGPFDKQRHNPIDAGTKLLLCPGGAQIYYGDETSRSLDIPGTQGDATLRSFMNWDELASNHERNGHRVKQVLAHWQKLGQFRRAHPAVGAGVHTRISTSPYWFKRKYRSGSYTDAVVVGLDLPKGEQVVEVGDLFPEGAKLRDYYSGKICRVRGGKVNVRVKHPVVLLGY